MVNIALNDLGVLGIIYISVGIIFLAFLIPIFSKMFMEDSVNLPLQERENYDTPVFDGIGAIATCAIPNGISETSQVEMISPDVSLDADCFEFFFEAIGEIFSALG